MKLNTFLLFFTIILSMSLISAITIYSGEVVEIELQEPYDYYSVVGNTTEVFLEVIQNGNNVTVIPDKYSQHDSYELVFFNAEKEIITVYNSGGGGGGSRTKYVDRNTTEYIPYEVEVMVEGEAEAPGETIETEKIVYKTSWIFKILPIVFFLIILYLVFKEPKIDERRYE